MALATVTTALGGQQSVDLVLRPVHNRWVEDARRFLEPALEPGDGFWNRWAAVRYLADDFQEQLEWERTLVGELRSFLEPTAAERLAHEGDRLSRLRLELDRIGRRRGSATEFAAGARALLEQLGLWCAEIELAACGIARDDLPAEGAAVLAHLEATSQIKR